MTFETPTSPRKPLSSQLRRFHSCCLMLGLLALPASSWAAYFPGPPEVLSALQFNSQGEVVLDTHEFSQGHLVPIDPFSGELRHSQSNVSKEENLYGQAEPGGSKVDPYSDNAIVEDDPFAVDTGSQSGFEEDPFAEEEKKIAHMPDPFARWYNRPVYVFNDHFYEYFLRPVAQTYKDLIAEGFRIMIRNLYNTSTFPGRLVSSILQFKFDKAGRVISRVLINCTLGFFCMADVANEEFDIKPVDEDFGQVLGFYGIPSGPYLVLPLLGPSSVRDGVGRAVDALMNPLFWVVPNFSTGVGLTSERMVNETSFFIEDIKALKESAIDPYESLRDFYNQRREILIDE